MNHEFASVLKLALVCGTFLSVFAIIAMSARRIVRRDTPRVPDEVAARLERIEQAVDAIAIEVERVSEGQRFTSKLLAERESPNRAPARQITPH